MPKKKAANHKSFREAIACVAKEMAKPRMVASVRTEINKLGPGAQPKRRGNEESYISDGKALIVENYV